MKLVLYGALFVAFFGLVPLLFNRRPRRGSVEEMTSRNLRLGYRVGMAIGVVLVITGLVVAFTVERS